MVVISIGICQPKVFPKLPKRLNEMMVPSGKAVLYMPIARPSSKRINHLVNSWAAMIDSVSAPSPDTARPRLKKRNFELMANITVPANIKKNEIDPVSFMPKRSEISPAGMVMKIPGKANKLIKRPI